MKLDRNVSADGRQKYGLIKNRRLSEVLSSPAGEVEAIDPEQVANAVLLLERAGIIDWGDSPETEFFVMRLKDDYALAGLSAYAQSACLDGNIEYGGEVFGLARRAGMRSMFRKVPD